MVRIPYHISRLQANVNRRVYRRGLPWMVRRPALGARPVPVIVYAMSCERDLPEQAASIYSFLRHVGTPTRFIVVSDGSYTERSRSLLESISPCVTVVDFGDVVEKNLPASVQEYAAKSSMGRKLALELSLPIEQPTIYTDSDVLFFSGGAVLLDLIQAGDRKPRYLLDLPGALDKRLLWDDAEQKKPVNGGFLLLKEPLDWGFALDRLKQLREPVDYFTEQTLVHLTMHHNNAVALPSQQFVLQTQDQFWYQDMYSSKPIVLRHYVSTVRNKFWLRKCWR